MKLFAVIGLEWKRIWRNKLTRAGLFAGLVLPLLYSSLYLWANWDPYGNLDKLPVALVNLDQGGVDGGKHVNYGRDLSQHLQEDHSLDWHIVSKAEAMNGLSGDKYYMVLSIPTSFTKDILSVNTRSPHPTHLDFIPNQGKNYLAGQIVKRVQGEIAASVNQDFSQKFISGMLAVLGKEQNGLSTIAATANKLSNGADSVNQGAKALYQGMKPLSDGASTFAGRLANATAYGKMPSPEKLSNIMSHPVQDDTTILNPVAKYGVGLAPYFIPLSLWVGALMLYFLIALREGRWRIAPVSNRMVMLGKFALLWVFGVAQAVVASTVMLWALGLHVESVLGFYGYNIALSVTDVTLIGMFIFILGTGPGRFVAIALLILQLTSSAGTFPIELAPRFFQFLHPVLPMSYAVWGLRNLTAIGDYGAVWHTAFVLLGYLAFALLVVMLTVPRKLRASELKRADQLVS